MEEFKSEDEDSEVDRNKKNSISSKEEAKDHNPPAILYNQKCVKHNLIIHSYVKLTKELLCTRCIYERNLSASVIEIVP